MAGSMLIARGERDNVLLSRMVNRHGLITGATGTGKTVSLRVLAENFSRLGVPVFLADIKGDVSGIIKPGGPNPKIEERRTVLGIPELNFTGYPVEFWDLYGQAGHPVRTTVSEMGPMLMARLLNLNETQAGALNIVFRVADEQGLLLLDLKDLRSMVHFVGDNASEFRTAYGNVSPATIGAIQRNLLSLESEGAETFFGEPALDLMDFLQTDGSGRGVINILIADQLINAPKTYATFLLWLMAELFETLPEVGDPEKPRIVFFFDEAHLLFADAPDVVRQKVEQLVRLIRSKGVGIYFVTQNPADIPVTVLGQLGNRIQHALRAFTPLDQKAVRAAAQTFRPNPKLNVEQVITELGVGEALVSFLDEQGRPEIVDRALIFPPESQLPPISPEERLRYMQSSTVAGVYERSIDRESAYEMLKKRAEATATATPPAPARSARTVKEPPSAGAQVFDAFTKSAARAVGSSLGRSLIRGIFGSLSGGSRRRRY